MTVMKKKIIALSVLAILSNNVSANERSSINQDWIGGFGEYYNIDGDRFIETPKYDDGHGVGFEYGKYFNDSWAGRIEFSYLDIEGQGANKSIYGERVGVDALYFPEQSNYYVFAGLKVQHFDETTRLGNIGLGRHWNTNSNWRFITEVAGYHDFGENYRDYSIKLGVAYAFGGSKSTPRSVDNDKDGVPDSRDNCLNSPLGSNVDRFGCLVVKQTDADNDGILDNIDLCPNTPSVDKVDSKGCSIFEENELTMQLSMQFANNSSKVVNNDLSQLESFVAFMKRFPNTKAVIEGHSSAPGEEQYNLWLSQKRATAVKQLLIAEYSIDANRLDTIGYGESKLIDTRDTLKANITNRRIVANIKAIERKKVTK